MLMPKKVKYRYQHRKKFSGNAKRGTEINFGDYGLKALGSTWITANQIESARIAINRFMKREGKIYIRIFPDNPFTKKPLETRQGKGKGSLEAWTARVKPGRIMFEISGVPHAVAKEAMRLASHKLPIKTKFICRPGLAEDVH